MSFKHARFLSAITGLCLASSNLLAQPAISVGSRVELFTDDYLVEKLSGDAKKVLQKPEPKEVVFTTDAPWEGNTSGYMGVFQDGEKYRLYYRGSSGPTSLKEHYNIVLGPDKKLVSPEELKKKDPYPPETSCVAESTDGIHWTRPEVGIFERDGSKKNNIVWTGDSAAHNFTVFKDGNPAAAPNARYKAIGGKGKPGTFISPDGYRFERAARTDIKEGTFDSQNLAFWDAEREEYRFYWRYFPRGKALGIRTATSKDFITWSNEADLNYVGKTKDEDLPFEERFHLYTNAIQPYFNAPHIYIGFPTRFFTRKNGLSWPLLMTSRDGVNFDRWDDPLIPTTAPANRDTERSNFMIWGMLQLPGKPDEISVYSREAYRQYGPCRVRRFVYRLDGFVSVNAGADGGELLTKPLIFKENQLIVNYKAHDGGSLQVEIIDEKGKALDGFALANCEPLTGDSTKAIVKWKEGSNLSNLSKDKGLQFRFVLKNADLFSIKL